MGEGTMNKRPFCQCGRHDDYIDTLHFIWSSSTYDFRTLPLQCIVVKCVTENLEYSEKNIRNAVTLEHSSTDPRVCGNHSTLQRWNQERKKKNKQVS